ncbi:MAG: hypothetical protein NVS2B6_13790 [Thermoleophilaceae bacterium]
MSGAVRNAFRREHLRKTVRIALVVGCVLTAINQLDVFLKGSATTFTVVKTALNFCVPFVVANLGLHAGRSSAENASTRVKASLRKRDNN